MRTRLRDLIREAGAEVVALDPWYRLFAGESSNASEQVDGVWGVCDRLLEDGLVEAVIMVHHANTSGLRTAGSWIFEGWPSTIIRLDRVLGVLSHRRVTFEKIPAPGSPLQDQQVQIMQTVTGYQAITSGPAPTGAGETLAALIVAEAGARLARQVSSPRINETGAMPRAGRRELPQQRRPEGAAPQGEERPAGGVHHHRRRWC